MDTQSITRLMIDTAVSRGIKDMTDDPKRSIRKLADMGKQFSTGRFQSKIIDIIQGLLENDNSPYYSLIEDALTHTDHKCIRKFGINMGYNCWTYGARVLRAKSEELHVSLPWLLMFRYDPDAGKKHTLTPEHIRSIIEQARPLGINSFCFFQKGGVIASNELISIFREYDQCGFFYFLTDAQVTAAQGAALKSCGNVMLSIDIDAPESYDTCMALRDSKLLYGIHHFYNDSDFGSAENAENVKRYLSYNSSMVFLIQKDDCCKSAGDFAKNSRMKQSYPCFIWDLYADVREISQIICENETLIEFSSDGSVHTPAGTDLNILDPDETLEHVLTKTMPVLNSEA
ncbi:MAG: hypothetical protein LKF52_09380 [Butyrivibrio sp.]|nr:hypothetical protein [Butyrivibrio sp.]